MEQDRQMPSGRDIAKFAVITFIVTKAVKGVISAGRDVSGKNRHNKTD